MRKCPKFQNTGFSYFPCKNVVKTRVSMKMVARRDVSDSECMDKVYGRCMKVLDGEIRFLSTETGQIWKKPKN